MEEKNMQELKLEELEQVSGGKKVYNMSLKKTDFINLYGKYKFEECVRHWYNTKDISEFWTRWHITLGAWLRDYIYYPVSLSKKLAYCKMFLTYQLSINPLIDELY